MSRTFVCVLALITVLCSNVKLSLAQSSANNQTAKNESEKQIAQLSPNAEKVKKALMKIGQSNDATIFLKNGGVFVGSIKSLENTQVMFRHIETKQLVEIKYEDVEKVWKGIATQGPLGNWVKPKYRKIGFVIGLTVALILPLVLVATMRD